MPTMRILLNKILAASPAKGWVSSAVVHATGFGALVVFSLAGPPPRERATFAARSTPSVSLLAAISSPPRPQTVEAPEVYVEVAPLEAQIAQRRFTHTPSRVVLQESLDEVARLSETPPVDLLRRERREELVPAKSQATKIVVEKRPLQEVVLPADSLVASLPSTESTLPDFENNSPPVYPQIAIARRWEGTVLLRVHVAADGAVADVEISSSSGHAVLDGAAVTAVRTWRAAPARQFGEAVSTVIRLPVRFNLP